MSVKQDIIDNRVNMDDVISCVSKHMNGNDNIHGLSHCQRVERNAIRLQHPGVNMTVARLFAYFHDACRSECKTQSEGEHGLLASELVLSLRNSLLKNLSDDEVELLSNACKLHTTTYKTGNPTIDTCFDADRLDLWRLIHIKPIPERMATSIGAKLAKNIHTIIQEETTLDFSQSTINYDCPTFLAIRISKIDRNAMIDSYHPWNFSAKSFTASFPGIFAINMFWLSVGFDCIFRLLLATSISPDDIRIIILEYSPKDIIQEKSGYEFSLKHGNIIDTLTIAQFYYFCCTHNDIFDSKYVKKVIEDSLACQYFFRVGDKRKWLALMSNGIQDMNQFIYEHAPYKRIYREELEYIRGQKQSDTYLSNFFDRQYKKLNSEQQ